MEKYNIELFKDINEISHAKSYWESILSRDLNRIDLYYDNNKTSNKKELSKVIFDGNLSEKLMLMSNKSEKGLFILLLSALEIVLYKYCLNKYITIGSALTGSDDDINFGNEYILFNACLNNDMTFKDVIINTKSMVRDSYSYQYYPIERVLDSLGKGKFKSSINFVMEGVNLDSSINCLRQTESNAVLFLCGVENDKIFVKVEFNDNINKEFINRIMQLYKNVLNQLVSSPDMSISDVEIVLPEERKKILEDFNNTNKSYDKNKTVIQIIEEQVKRTPDNIAIVCRDRKMTFRELNEQANRLARTLRKKGVNKNHIVGIMVERSIEMMVGIIAILKAGAAYLPINVEFPSKRVEYMMNVSNAELLLTRKVYLNNKELNCEILDFDDDEIYDDNNSNMELTCKYNDLIYVLFTSGSTGNPKGVMVENYSVINRLIWAQRYFNFNEKDAILQKTTFTFDVSVWELFSGLMFGCKTILLEAGGEKIPESIIGEIYNNKVTRIHFVPSMFKVFLKYLSEYNESYKLSSLKSIFCSGESLGINEVLEFNKVLNKSFGTKLYNLYGPTEATVDVSCFECSNADKMDVIPIGKPIDNTQLYVLNEDMSILPIGMDGELYISGDGVARGYVNDLERTEENFIENPFCKGKKLYKTGDLVRWLPDGNIEFIGRIDNQVKINGQRIELSEIQYTIKKYSGIKDAVIIRVKMDGNETERLCAYYISESPIDQKNLEDFLREYLPNYMIPYNYVRMEKFALTDNGKIDVKSLPAKFNDTRRLNNYMKPGNVLEKNLCDIWENVIGIEDIGVNDSFFDLNGTSLNVIQIVTKVKKELSKNLTVEDVFREKTIHNISKLLEQRDMEMRLMDIKVELKKNYYAVSGAQKRIYLVSQNEKDSINYNMPFILQLNGHVNKDKLEFSFNNIIKRHEALRTSFEIINSEIVQKINSVDYYKIDVEQVSDEEVKSKVREFIKPFSLDKAPLIRIKLLSISNEKHILMIDIHHIVCDGSSLKIIMDELRSFYNDVELPELKYQYKDYSEYLNRLFKSDHFLKEKEYWLDKLKGNLPILKLPYDFDRSDKQWISGDSVDFELDEESVEKLRQIAKESEVTMYMILLSIFNILLSKYSGMDDIIIGSPYLGRNNEELQKMIGMFVNTLVMRNNPKEDMTFRNFILDVRKNCIEAFQNSDYQFNDLVDDLEIEILSNKNPIFDVLFALQDKSFYHTEGMEFNIELYPYTTKTSKFDMFWSAVESDGKIYFGVEYCNKIFKEETINMFCDNFKNIVSQVIDNFDEKISNIKLLSEIGTSKSFVSGEEGNIKEICGLFQEHVKNHPHEVAIQCENKSMTYLELDKWVNKLANFINDYNYNHSKAVGLLLNRSEYANIAILGALKAHVTFIPIDIEYPYNRIKTIVEDAKVEVILSCSSELRVLRQLCLECSSLDCYLILDSDDVDKVEDIKSNKLMDEKIWDWFADGNEDKIKSGAWISSYTGRPFSQKEMEEYASNVFFKLENYLNKNTDVLEVGCSSGITMYKLSQYVNSYHGIDLSNKIIENNKSIVKRQNINNITLERKLAHEVDQIDKKFDIVIMNSVIQYFPGIGYLKDVVKKSISSLKEDGIIFIGDVMDLELKDDLTLSLVELKKNALDNQQRIKTDFSNELFLPKSFFISLAKEFPDITDVHISRKIYSIENELTKYRYDCIIRINKHKDEVKNVKVQKHYYGVSMLNSYSDKFSMEKNNPENIAYVLYTSGSIGKPKGVMVKCNGLNNIASVAQKVFDFEQGKKILSITPYSFDISMIENVIPLALGMGIVIVDDNRKNNIDEVCKLISDKNVDIIQFTPSRMRLLLKNTDNARVLKKIRCIILGGEPLSGKIVENIQKYTQAEIYNGYGPTETTIYSTIKQITSCDSVNIGKPVSNTQVCIMNKNNTILRRGIEGELCISGVGVSAGYLNNYELTNEKFINNPLNDNGVLYKTGDLAKILKDGEVEYLGRMDNQIKIRGFRIELDEINSTILKYVGIKNVVTMEKADKQNVKSLITFFVSDLDIDISKLRKYLSEFLPDYMIPSYFVRINEIPLTHNGKVDYKKLSNNVLIKINKDEDIEIRNNIDKKLITIWEDVLEVSNINIDDTFYDLGGHSLKIIEILQRINDEFNIKLNIYDFYSMPTIRHISDKINLNINSNNDIVDLNEDISKVFNNCAIKEIEVNNNKYIILFADNDIPRIKKYIKEGYSEEQLPNYIVEYNKVHENMEHIKDKTSLLSVLGIRGDNEDIDYGEEFVSRQQNSLEDSIFKDNRIISKYDCIYLQKYMIKIKRDRIVSAEVEVKNVYDVNNIKKSLLKLINSNGLFRTVIEKEDSDYKFYEYDKCGDIDLGILDFSRYSEDDIANTFRRLISSNKSQNFIFKCGIPLYKILVIKEDDKNYKIIFTFHHLVFDKASVNILVSKFYDIYNSINKDSNVKLEDYSYKSYVDFIKQNCNKENIDYVIGEGIYDKWEEDMNFIKMVALVKTGGYVFSDAVVIEKSVNLKLNLEEEVLKLLLEVLQKTFKLNSIPMRIIVNGRNIREEEFKNILGDCHSSIIYIFNLEKGIDNSIKEFRNFKQDCYDKRIDFPNLAHGDCAEYENAKKIELMLNNTPFTFNFIGNVNVEGEEELKKLTVTSGIAQNRNNAYSAYGYIMNNKIRLLLFNGINADTADNIENAYIIKI